MDGGGTIIMICAIRNHGCRAVRHDDPYSCAVEISYKEEFYAKEISILAIILAIMLFKPSTFEPLKKGIELLPFIEKPASPLVKSARKQIGETLIYDSKYVRLEYY